MTGYDFDKTVYDGDSFTRFYLYCLPRYLYIVVLLPFQATALLLFGLRLIDRRTVKRCFDVYLRLIPDVPRRVERFWDKHIRRIKPWYLAQKKDDDLIVSASPEFLLAPLCARLGLSNLIATRTDARTRRISGKNCYGQEKVVRYREKFGTEQRLEAFYSDSMSDLPMMLLSGRGILVRGDRRTEVDLKSFDKPAALL